MKSESHERRMTITHEFFKTQNVKGKLKSDNFFELYFGPFGSRGNSLRKDGKTERRRTGMERRKTGTERRKTGTERRKT